MNKSITEAPLTIVGAMGEADEILGPNRIWIPVNTEQKLFIEKLYKQGRIDAKRIKEIESIVSGNSRDIYDFLRKRGSSASIKPLGRDEIGIASIMDIVVEWIKEGANVDIETLDKKKHKGVRIGESGVRFYKSGKHNHPIASLITKTEDRVFMTMLDEEEAIFASGKFNLHKKIEAIIRDADDCSDFGGLKFPKVDLDQEEDMAWLIGINTTSTKGDPAVIKYACQKNRLRINQVGARFRSEFRGGMTLMATMQKQKPDHIIDKPFLCWIMRKGFAKPLFAAYMSQEDWKDPGDIRN